LPAETRTLAELARNIPPKNHRKKRLQHTEQHSLLQQKNLLHGKTKPTPRTSGLQTLLGIISSKTKMIKVLILLLLAVESTTLKNQRESKGKKTKTTT